jgi:steroid delta-isomerase-like uncharacterized protein
MVKSTMTLSEAANIETVRKLYDEVLNHNKPELLPALLSPDIVFHTATEERGLAAYQALTDRLRVAFAEMHFTIHDLIASGDRVAMRWSMSAKHSGPLAGIPATGKRVEQRANVIYRMEGGKIAEGWAQMDQLGMLRQIGIDPLGNAKAAPAN